MTIEEPFGPLYPDLGATIAKSRHKARIDPSHRQAHGEAVLTAIRAKQRSELQRELPSRAPHCASGTAHNTGAAILKAVKVQNAARIAAKGPWTPHMQERSNELYAEAIRAKKAARAPMALAA